jgi:hypothetical protein
MTQNSLSMQQSPVHSRTQLTDLPSLQATTRSFNSSFLNALVQGRSFSNGNARSRLVELQKTPEFLTLLKAIQQLASTSGKSESSCSESMIGVFREIESLWSQILLDEGLKRITSVVQNPNESE